MNKIVIIPNTTKDNAFLHTKAVIDKLTSLGFNTYIDERCGLEYKSRQYKEFPEDTDLIVVVGGDGTVIDASKLAVAYDIPIIAVNLGKVGYLSEVDPGDLSPFDLIAAGNYFIEEKMLISIVTDGKEEAHAVNDIVVSHSDYLGLSDFRVEDSVGNVIKYRADALVFSTPTGSTAYSLSAGGPIVAHDVESILLTPVSPHSFVNRSVIFNSTEVIKVTNNGEKNLVISVDGRFLSSLPCKASCTVKKSKSKFKMLTFSKNSMFTNLFRKMKILEDVE